VSKFSWILYMLGVTLLLHCQPTIILIISCDNTSHLIPPTMFRHLFFNFFVFKIFSFKTQSDSQHKMKKRENTYTVRCWKHCLIVWHLMLEKSSVSIAVALCMCSNILNRCQHRAWWMRVALLLISSRLCNVLLRSSLLILCLYMYILLW
jgi:hypothetical protein